MVVEDIYLSDIAMFEGRLDFDENLADKRRDGIN